MLSSVSDHSEYHDDDVSMTSDRDSGIGGYDSEIDSITASSCSSPDFHEFPNDQFFNCNPSRQSINRPPSPEFGITPMTQCYSPKDSITGNRVQPAVKPYVCYSCNCGFTGAASLRAHIRHSHPRKGIASSDYRCAYCLKSFQCVESLECHVLDHQRVKTQRTPTFPLPKAYHTVSKSSMRSLQSSSGLPRSRLSANSLAFSIDSLCANVVPEKKKNAQVTHLHLVDSFQQMKEPVHPVPPSQYSTDVAWLKKAASCHPHADLFYSEKAFVQPVCTY